MVNKNMKENDKCNECGYGVMELDALKAELSCTECGIVVPTAEIMDANAGKTTYGGESATHSATQTNCDTKGQLGTHGSYMDLKGVPAGQRKDWNRRAKINRSTTRLTHPLSLKVRKAIKEMYGDYAARAAEPFIKMTCKPLKPELEEIRQGLSDKAMKKALGMPKQSICRKGTGVRGDGSQQNIVLLAMAIVEVAGRLGILSKMDRRAGMDQFNITGKQLINAVKTIMRHYKARCGMKWETAPQAKTPAEIREDGVEQAVQHIHDMLGDVLTEDEHIMVNYETEARLALLNEGTAEALTGNNEVRMVVCTAFYATLVDAGLQTGMADKLGGVFGITGSGIRSRYEDFVTSEQSGMVNFNGAYMRGEESCMELLFAKHPDHTLIQRGGLDFLWDTQKSASHA